MEGRIERRPRAYAQYLLRYTRADGVSGHYLTADRSRAQRKAEAGKRAGWAGYQLLGCEVIEAWEHAETAKDRHMARQRKGA